MGTKIKLQLAAALATTPQLLILDTPTSGLDPIARHTLLALLQDFISDDQTSVYISTHSIITLAKVADYVTYLLTGLVTFTGHLRHLLHRYINIKGGPKQLTPGLQATIIGLQQSRVGFSGIWPADQADQLPHSIVQTTVHYTTYNIAFGKGRRATATFGQTCWLGPGCIYY